MNVDTVERFFKLTLDNVFRFVCAAMFVLTLTTAFTSRQSPLEQSPLGQLRESLAFLAVPTGWITPVEQWISARPGLVVSVAAAMLLVSVGMAAISSGTRSGSSALFSFTLLVQASSWREVLGQIAWPLGALIAVCGIATLLWRRAFNRVPAWVTAIFKALGRVAKEVVGAAFYVLSPVGWLLGEDRPPNRGSRSNPVNVRLRTDG